MHFLSENTTDGVTARQFTLGHIPGLLWTPATDAGTAAGRPLVLLGHGGGQHKQAPGVVARARRFVSELGCNAVAIDVPGHGDRPRTEREEAFSVGAQARVAAGEPLGPHFAAYNRELAGLAVPDWRSTLDALQKLEDVGPVGYWGLSMAGAIGAALVAAEPRIAAAVLGLVGLEAIGVEAAEITIPVQFVLQWDDEAVPRASGLAAFDALASRDKTLLAHPGPHIGVPRSEVDSALLFFRRHLC